MYTSLKHHFIWRDIKIIKIKTVVIMKGEGRRALCSNFLGLSTCPNMESISHERRETMVKVTEESPGAVSRWRATPNLSKKGRLSKPSLYLYHVNRHSNVLHVTWTPITNKLMWQPSYRWSLIKPLILCLVLNYKVLLTIVTLLYYRSILTFTSVWLWLCSY